MVELSSERDLRAAYSAHAGELYGFALRSLGEAGLAEGAVQETFLRAWRAGAGPVGGAGRRFSAGSFRYIWDGGSEAVLNPALDLSRADRIAVRAGARTFVAPVGQGAGAATWNPTEEEA